MTLADLKEERVRGRVSLWLLTACALIGTTAFLALLAARYERLRAVERCHVQLDVMADIRSAAIEHWVADGFGDARTIAGFSAVATLASARSTAPPTPSIGEASRAQLEGVLASVVKNHGFLNAVVLAPDGRILLGAGEKLQLDRACLDLTGRSQAARRPEVDFHLHGGAKLVVQFAAPVFTDQAAAPVGVVLLTSDPEDWLCSFLRHHPDPSETGETLLVRKDGDDVLYLGPLPYGANQTLTLRRSLLTPGLAAAAALQGREVFSEYTDYGGEWVFAVTRSLKGTPWAMIVKVERAEMIREYRRELAGTMTILTGIVLALAGVGYGAWHRQRGLARLALARSEARVASLLDQGSDAVLFISRDGVVAEANARACGMFGHSRTEMVGMTVAELETVGPEDGVARRLVGLTGPHTAVFDAVHVRKDGSEFSGEVSARVVAEAGQTWTVAVIRDVTARKQAEKELRRERNRVQQYLDVAGVMLMVLDTEGRIASINRKGCEILGYQEAELIGHQWLDRFLPEGVREETRAVFSALVGGAPAPVEYHENPVLTGTGSERVVAFHSKVLRDASGRVTGVLTSGEDITERKEMEESLRRTGERLELALEGAGLGTYDVDLASDRSTLDPRYLAMLGYGPGEIDLSRERFEGMVHPDDFPALNAAYEAHFACRTPIFNAEYRMRHKDGHWVWVQDQGKVVARNPGGRPLRLLGVHLDITGRKVAEIEREELVANVRAMSTYLSTLGEELRARIARELHDRIGQNLAAIALDLDIFRSRLPAEALGAIGTRLDDAGGIVEQMVHDVRDLMAELRPPLLDEIGLLAALRGHGNQFSLRTGVAFQIEGGDSWPRLASGTETAVFRIAQEALTNVAMHARAQRVSARFSVAKDTVVMVIDDDGCGFDMDALGKSGVSASWGLLSMQERAKAVGGAVRVESSVGAGTRVTIEVPR